MARYSLRHSPGPLIRRVHQIGMSIFANAFDGIDLTPLQFSILWTLRENPGIDQITLAQAVALDRTTCSNIVIRLERKGSIRRKTDPANKRAKLLQLTASGARLLESAEAPMDRVQVKLIEPLSAQERKAFVACLEKLAESSNELSRAPMRFLPLK